jgi:hypothetical protein
MPRIDRRRVIVDHLAAPSDVNGNPRRVYLVRTARDGHVIAAIDEGYEGSSAWSKRFPNGRTGLYVNVTGPEYTRRLKRGH